MTRALLVPGLTALLLGSQVGHAVAAPPWLERLGEYRIVDASGRVAPRSETDATGRIAYKPAYAPPPLLRARPFYASGYAGAAYGRNARRAPLEPTGYYAGEGRKACGHVGPCRHGR